MEVQNVDLWTAFQSYATDNTTGTFDAIWFQKTLHRKDMNDLRAG